MHKKRKADKTFGTNTLTEDDVHEHENVVTKVAQDILDTLNTQKVSIVDQVENHLNKLIESINEVKSTMEDDT